SRAVTRLLTSTKYGTLWLGRAGAVVGLLAVLAIGTALGRPSRSVTWAGTAVGAALLLVIAATGHASAVPRRTWLAVGADWLHLLAGAVWIGGLVQLAVALPAALGHANDYTRRLLLAGTIRRFSLVAGTCVAVVIATGVFAGTLHVPSWQAMADTFYGAALTTKLLLVVPLLLLGAINLLVIHPRFVRAARAASPGARVVQDVAGRRWFQRLVLGEAILAVAVLGATAWLSGLPPATTAPGEGKPVQETVRVVGPPALTLTFEVTPNQAGTNSFVVQLADAQGRPLQAQRVALALSHVDMDMGEREVVLTGVENGRYGGGGGQLSMAGRWRGEIRLRGVGSAPAPGPSGAAPDTVVPVAFTAGQPAGTGRPLISPARVLVYALNPTTGLAAVVLVIAVLLAVLASGPRIHRRQRLPVLAGAAFFALVGLGASGLSVAAAYQRSVAVAQPVSNPVPATPASVGRGQQIYASSCLVCHGVEGRGDGPAGRALRPPPADLSVHMAAGHTDQQLFDWITNGVPGTAMPAWKEQLTVEERWHVINYIRSLANPQ
ncbi:MAG TPA: CopD family protein, partial [Chloroflexota bacterium]|nr:CopD family protein [Chloroflexota bacterium]